MLFKASAPGSLMLLGEYAVLHDQPALVCAVDKRMRVSLAPRDDQIIELISSLGHYQTTVTALEVTAPFQFVLATLKQYQSELTQGCTIQIESEFSHQIGFGSSAAVTVATLAAVSAWLGYSLSTLELIKKARAIVQAVQGIGSGADVAASVQGGIVAYAMQSLVIESFACTLPLAVVYSGSKTPTVNALQHVKQTFAEYPDLFKTLVQAIGQCASDGIIAVKQQQFAELGKLMTIQQGLMSALTVSTPVLNNIIAQLNLELGILGAKISGSGLGDCLIGLGRVSSGFSLPCIDVAITTQGVLCEKSG